MPTTGFQRAASTFRRGRPVYLMISLFLLLLLFPVSEYLPAGGAIIGAGYSLVLISAAWAIHENRRILFATIILGLPWMVLSWLRTLGWFSEYPRLLETFMLASFNLFIFLILVLMVRPQGLFGKA